MKSRVLRKGHRTPLCQPMLFGCAFNFVDNFPIAANARMLLQGSMATGMTNHVSSCFARSNAMQMLRSCSKATEKHASWSIL